MVSFPKYACSLTPLAAGRVWWSTIRWASSKHTSFVLVNAVRSYGAEDATSAPADGCGSAHDQQLCQRHDGVLPPLQTIGPRLPDGFREQIPDYDLELAESIYIGLLERQDQGDFAADCS